jgi:dihydroorotate dehydrogenase (NAD+) catalytic subunit
MKHEDDKETRPNLAVQLGALTLKNPVTVASGTFGFAEEFKDFFDLELLGAVVTKTITLEPRLGNTPPRLVETASGLLNSIGLQNPGLEGFLREKMPFLRGLKCPVIVSIAGRTADEYVQLAEKLNAEEGLSALELNLSCPNVKEGGRVFATVPGLLAEVVSKVRKTTPLPLIAKLSPLVSDIVAMAKAAVDSGSDAVAIANTFPALAVDIHARRPRLGAGSGGLSGPAIRPIIVLQVSQVHQSLPQVPIIAMGGITCSQDALEYIIVGASAVAVGTALFADPTTPVNVLRGIEDYCCRQGVSAVKDLVGTLDRSAS